MIPATALVFMMHVALIFVQQYNNRLQLFQMSVVLTKMKRMVMMAHEESVHKDGDSEDK